MAQDDGFDWVYYLDVLNKGQYRRMLAQEVDGLRAENARLSRAVINMEAERARIPMKAPPMTDDAMIERVARAICCPDGECHPRGRSLCRDGCLAGHEFSKEAHAAINAMRLPSDEMVAVGADSIARTTHAPDNGPPLVFTAHASFTTMIAAALSESETGEG